MFSQIEDALDSIRYICICFQFHCEHPLVWSFGGTTELSERIPCNTRKIMKASNFVEKNRLYVGPCVRRLGYMCRASARWYPESDKSQFMLSSKPQHRLERGVKQGSWLLVETISNKSEKSSKWSAKYYLPFWFCHLLCPYFYVSAIRYLLIQKLYF